MAACAGAVKANAGKATAAMIAETAPRRAARMARISVLMLPVCPRESRIRFIPATDLRAGRMGAAPQTVNGARSGPEHVRPARDRAGRTLLSCP
ncbi:hypothetical protein GCM10009546_67840 [Actinomadura livida]|uniref:Uncharacterized protein n=1 Tax=Actinomadura livida TaxID=79909 RepID=A0ABP3QRS6_9ACTN|nr:hypothetical protein GCM10010208_20360 [Actinomadura livida]